ncbi:MAG: magnesium/cobalt transporter CorA [Phycisphaerales bacterium]|nr:magnesium/cobalt transporter CorA [Phycisphaerae bacterium]NNM26814.1 magnesium/cobalt transporter CorA [Phycisphaerales bacterium]
MTYIPIFRKRPPPGTAPGTLRVPEDAAPSTVDVMQYDADELTERRLEPFADVAAGGRPGLMTWVDVTGLADLDLLRTLGERFDIHRLALEDVVNVHQRAKTELYDDQLFVVARMVRPDTQEAIEQVSFFLGDGCLLSIQERRGDCFEPVRDRLRAGRRTIRGSGPDYLLYALLDAIVDGYYPVLEELANELEVLDERVMTDPDESLLADIHSVKHRLLMYRRSLRPHREAIGALLRDESKLISAPVRVYFRDCYDHVVQALDMIDNYRELVGSLQDVYLSSISTRMNEVMKVLTIFAAIFIPLSFLAGLYGMNFERMPELRLAWGYPALLIVMATMAGSMLLMFRRRGWLGRRRRPAGGGR